MSCAASGPAPGAYEASIAAVPMVKASAPAARTAATRSGELTLPATTTAPEVEKTAPAGGDEVERLGLGRAIGENVDARAAFRSEGAALRLDLKRRAAEPGRMASWRAGERQIAGRRAIEDLERLLDVNAAHKPIDAEVAA